MAIADRREIQRITHEAGSIDSTNADYVGRGLEMVNEIEARRIL